MSAVTVENYVVTNTLMAHLRTDVEVRIYPQLEFAPKSTRSLPEAHIAILLLTIVSNGRRLKQINQICYMLGWSIHRCDSTLYERTRA